MPQIASQYPGNLENIFGQSSMLPAAMAGQQFYEASQNNQINQDQALQDLFTQRQMDPLQIQGKQLANDTLQAQLPGVQAESSIRQNNAALNHRQLAGKMSAADLEQMDQMAGHLTNLGNYVKTTGRLPPGVQLPEELQNMLPDDMISFGNILYENSNAVRQERIKQQADTERQLAITRAQGANQLALDKSKFEHGAYLKSWSMGISKKISLEGDPIKKYNLAVGAGKEASLIGDKETADYYYELANEIKPQAIAAYGAKARAKPGDADIDALGVQTVPDVDITPPSQKAKQEKTIARTGTHNGRKVIQYSDGSTEYAD